MKQSRYRLFKRGQTFYSHDNQTGRQESLRTSNRTEALKLVLAKNDTHNQSYLNLALGRTYLNAHDPTLITRTWDQVMEQMLNNGTRESSRARARRAFQNTAFDEIRSKKLCETVTDDFLRVLKCGLVSVNHYLRRLHNLALKYGWLVGPILPPKVWPRCEPKVKRALTLDEHQRILGSESSAEWRLYYEVLWELGASQTDAANLRADNIDWGSRTLSYQRKKLSIHSKPACIIIGERLESLLRKLPAEGALFPHVSRFGDGVRAWHFKKRCRASGVKGVTLHSYRYAWAERAARLGYPERWAQVALGHNSRAVHHAYAKRAQVVVPSLESYEHSELRTASVAMQ